MKIRRAQLKQMAALAIKETNTLRRRAETSYRKRKARPSETAMMMADFQRMLDVWSAVYLTTDSVIELED